MKHENAREYRLKLKRTRENGALRADLLRYYTPERAEKRARLLKTLRPHSKAVTEERLAAVLAARRRREVLEG